MKTASAKAMMNGLDTAKLTETVAGIQADPKLARFEFRASNRWIMGAENRSTIQGFYGAGREDDSRREPWTFTNGEPPVLLGKNEGANPVEFLLHAIAGCVTTTTVAHATARGINIESISTELSGDVDLLGFLGLDESVPAGFQKIRIKMRIKADCGDKELEDLVRFAQTHSPTASTVSRPVPIELTIAND